MHRSFLISLASCWLVLSANADEIRFSRDVLPLLSDRCFHCHGPDESNREAGLRLDQEDSALEDRGSGPAIARNKAAASQLILRITSSDPDVQMPPADSHRKPFSKREIEILRNWIDQGAPWGRHWAFEKPVRPQPPFDGEHPIDAFVRKRLESEGLTFAPAAEPHTLLRRVHYDLTGLPPTWEEFEKFRGLKEKDAYETVVDQLLASPHYAERMAMWWLDAARYSDTDGYQGDATRNNWPWRDWVVDAFHANQPFDQFTIEQFAGDLLPDATAKQKLATCFHRNHMFNGEGGRHPEESRIDYVIDRVNTTGTVWLGLTLGCTQCHSHKFDPVSHEDYYRLFAFFDSIDEDGKAGGGARPFLKFRSRYGERDVQQASQLVEARKARLAAAKNSAEGEFANWLERLTAEIPDDYSAWAPLKPSVLESVEGTILTEEPDQVIQASGPKLFQDDYRISGQPANRKVTGIRLEVFPHSSHTGGKLSRGKSGEFILTDVKLQVRRKGDTQTLDIEIASARATGEKNVGGRAYGKVGGTLDDDPRNGWTTQSLDAKKPYTAIFALAEPRVLAENEELIFVMLHRSTNGDANIGRFRVSTCSEPGNAVRSFDPSPRERLAADIRKGRKKPISGETRQKLLEQFLTEHALYQKAKTESDRANRQLSRFKRGAGNLNVNVLSERKQPRTSYILKRGVWDQKGKPVERGFPVDLFGASSLKPDSRLSLAKWLVSPENPLTARVIVNQLWQNCFGVGLVRTPNDFGLQGEFPTHPDLLDWLAVELQESGWNIKHLLKLIVTSRTYRQSSVVGSALRDLDPENRLLARNSRYRLPSWMIRDSALQSSGLLNRSIGGMTVMPYQPPGVWAEIFMGRFRYEPSQGTSQFRRTIYSFWRRSSAPTFLFDSSQRRVCEVMPRRTNTPLQALTLMNDLSLREASRQLARQAAVQPDTTGQLEYLFQSVLLRKPGPREQRTLAEKYRTAVEYYRKAPAEARNYLVFGQPENEVDSRHGELAALTLLASMIYNLDEAITRE
ncbi:MAG: PSD1 and planctomycete cytochrome C domain-containing protein [Planctomycetota bacterium]|nr:PSD1 and planctomycete cytochrome C domain-containing protein [Planctomycetota bacterium]